MDSRWAALLACIFYCSAVAAGVPAQPQPETQAQPAPQGHKKRVSPHGPLKQKGKASVYSRKLAHKPMADGTPLDLDSDAAASKQLPLGSKAQVTNLRNGKSAVVEIKDRGPYVPGRIIDLSPHTASNLDFDPHSVGPVEVKPLGNGNGPGNGPPGDKAKPETKEAAAPAVGGRLP